jgi:hypothetical protein
MNALLTMSFVPLCGSLALLRDLVEGDVTSARKTCADIDAARSTREFPPAVTVLLFAAAYVAERDCGRRAWRRDDRPLPIPLFP